MTVLRSMTAGLVFGLTFPLVGILATGLGVAEAHATHPVLFIVDLAPLVLAAAGWFVGVRTARLELAHADVEHLADERLVHLEAVNCRLESLIAHQSEVVGRIARELRIPVEVIGGFTAELGTAGSCLEESGQKELLGILEEETSNLGRIVDDLLVASDPDSSDLTILPVQFEMARAVRGVIAALRLFVQKPVETELETVPVYADPQRLTQIARNLIVNAVAHGGPNLLIRTYLSADTAVLEVHDDGDAIAPDICEHLFEPYWTRMRIDQGFGLGLTVAKSLANRMKGDLQYRHDDGWSIFRVELPVAPLSDLDLPIPVTSLVSLD